MSLIEHPDPGGSEGLVHQHVSLRTELGKEMDPKKFRDIAQHTFVPGLLKGLKMDPLGETNIYERSVSQCITTSHTRAILRELHRIIGDIHSCKEFETDVVVEEYFAAFGHQRWDATMVHRHEDEEKFKIQGKSGHGNDVEHVWEYQKEEVGIATPNTQFLFPTHESPVLEAESSYHYMVDSFYQNPLDQARAEDITKAIMRWRFDIAGIEALGKINIYEAVDLTEPGWTWIHDGMDNAHHEMLYSSDHHFSKPGEVNTRSDIFGYQQYTLAQVLNMMGLPPDSWKITAIKSTPPLLGKKDEPTEVKIKRVLGNHLTPNSEYDMNYATTA